MPKKSEPKTEERKKKVKLSEKEFEKKVIELAEKGLTSEKIGEFLRKEGVHPKDFNKKISKILKEEKKYINPDIKNLEEKLEKVKGHYEKNRQDKRAMRERERIFAKIRKLKKYFATQ